MDLLSLILNILWKIDVAIFCNTSSGMYSIPKESKYIAKFEAINNETHCVPLLFSTRSFMTYAPSFVLGKFLLGKTPLNADS